MNALASYLKQFMKTGGAGATTTSSASQHKATDILGDIHLLRYLAVNDIISFSMVKYLGEINDVFMLLFFRTNLIHYWTLYVRMILMGWKLGWKVLIGKQLCKFYKHKVKIDRFFYEGKRDRSGGFVTVAESVR